MLAPVSYTHLLIELPFALPTAVAGITLSKLYSGTGFFGNGLGKFGIDVAYTQAGLVVALVFVGIPFVIRAVQPVLEKMDNTYAVSYTHLVVYKRQR